MSNGQYQNPLPQNDPRLAEQTQKQPQPQQPAPRQAVESQQQTEAPEAEAQAVPRLAAADISAISVPEALPKASTQSGRKVEQSVRSAGRAGEQHITIQGTDVSVGASISCYFTVRTAPGNGLQVTIAQGSYSKTWQATGSVVTGIIPVGPIGLHGKVTVRDTTSGETFEEPYVWYSLNNARFSLWTAIKRLFWKSGA
jgi:hypothetical protein